MGRHPARGIRLQVASHRDEVPEPEAPYADFEASVVPQDLTTRQIHLIEYDTTAIGSTRDRPNRGYRAGPDVQM